MGPAPGRTINSIQSLTMSPQQKAGLSIDHLLPLGPIIQYKDNHVICQSLSCEMRSPAPILPA